MTETCNPPGVTDAGTVAVALVIVLLLAPDMGEIGVFGISLKRRLKQAEEQAASSEAKANDVQSQLQMLRIETLAQVAASSNSQASVHNYFGEFLKSEDAAAIPALDSDLTRKGQAFTHRSEPRMDVAGVEAHLSDEFAREAMRLIWNWEVLSASLDLPPYPRDGRREIPQISVTKNESMRFTREFEKELAIVRRARNTVAHAQPITGERLTAAVDMSRKLLGILDDMASDLYS